MRSVHIAKPCFKLSFFFFTYFLNFNWTHEHTIEILFGGIFGLYGNEFSFYCQCRCSC